MRRLLKYSTRRTAAELGAIRDAAPRPAAQRLIRIYHLKSRRFWAAVRIQRQRQPNSHWNELHTRSSDAEIVGRVELQATIPARAEPHAPTHRAAPLRVYATYA